MDAATLDIENRADCERYLVAAGHCRAGEVTEHRVLAGGVSSRTVLVAFADGRRWVLKQSLAKLRVAADWFSDPRRIHREALGMRVLGELAPRGSIPKLIFDDETYHVLGMEAVPEPHENWKAMLLAGKVVPRMFENFGQLLGLIHYEAWRDRDRLATMFDDRTFYLALRIEPYYEFTASQEPRAASFLRELIDTTNLNRRTLVHGDYSPKNVLVTDRLVLLDHEVIHWGDPAFDFGFALTHILSKALHLRNSRRALMGCAHLFTADYFEVYCSSPVAAGAFDHRLAERCVRHTLGCMLARVIGRSPLEYLTSNERRIQQEIAIEMMRDLPDEVPDLIERFYHDVEAN